MFKIIFGQTKYKTRVILRKMHGRLLVGFHIMVVVKLKTFMINASLLFAAHAKMEKLALKGQNSAQGRQRKKDVVFFFFFPP